MELMSVPHLRNLLPFILIGTISLFTPKTVLADPPGPPGRIVFLGKTADNQRSVWLSLTTAGSFEVEARNQVVDEWTQSQRGLHVTFSPIVSNGSGDPHSLFQIINGQLVFLDKDNQQGGIIFPPLPGGLPPGEVTPPIALPPVNGPITPPSGEVSNPTTPSTSDGSAPLASSSGETSDSRQDGFTRKAPITPGREFAKQPFLNIWADGRYFDIKDSRYGLDRKGDAVNLTIGADRRVNDDLVVGAMLARNTGKSSSFNHAWLNNAKGFSVGPYFGYRLLPNWGIDGNFGYGQYENDNNIAILKSRYLTKVYSTSLVATGVYNLGTIQLRPKPGIYYNYFDNAGYNMNATVNGILYSVPVNSYKFSYGFSKFALEASRSFTLVNGKITAVPYIELGVFYAFTRPNNGKILTGNLTMQRTSPWNGTARLGVRTLITRSLFIETVAGYLSLGQPHLNIWEARLFLSWAVN